MTTKNEKITLAFSITAFLVSIAAILVSIAIFRATTSSVIQASIGYKQRPEYLRFTETGDSRYPVSYAQEMPIRIANVGNEASTIIEMRVLVLEAENIAGISHPLELIEGDGVRTVSRAAAVLNPTYSDRDGDPVRWPIKLEPRDSIAIELK